MLTTFPDQKPVYRDAYLRRFSEENDAGEAAVRFETLDGTAYALVNLAWGVTVIAVKNADGDYARAREIDLPTYSRILREALAEKVDREVQTALLDSAYERTITERVDPEAVREEAVRLCLPHATGPNATLHQIISILERCTPPKVAYLLDSPEWTDIQRPEDTLKYNAGQCEAHAVLVASLCASVSIPAAVVIVDSKALRIGHALNYVCVGKGDDIDRLRATIAGCYRERGYQTPEWPEFLITDHEKRIWAVADTTGSPFLGHCKGLVQMGFMEYVTGREGKTEGRWIAPTKTFSKYNVGSWIESYLYNREVPARASSPKSTPRWRTRLRASYIEFGRSLGAPPAFFGQFLIFAALIGIALAGFMIATNLELANRFGPATPSASAQISPSAPNGWQSGLADIDPSAFSPVLPPGPTKRSFLDDLSAAMSTTANGATCYRSRDGAVAVRLVQRDGVVQDSTVRRSRPGAREPRFVWVGKVIIVVNDDDGLPLPTVPCPTLRFEAPAVPTPSADGSATR